MNINENFIKMHAPIALQKMCCENSDDYKVTPAKIVVSDGREVRISSTYSIFKPISKIIDLSFVYDAI